MSDNKHQAAWREQREKMAKNGMPHSAMGYAKIAFDAAWSIRDEDVERVVLVSIQAVVLKVLN